MRKIILFLILLLIISCSKQQKPLDVFNSQELKIFKELIQTNDSIILQLTKDQHIKINKAYDNYLKLLNQQGLKGITENLFFTGNKMIDELCDLGIFNKESFFDRSGAKKGSIYLQRSGNYIRFLEQVARYNSIINKYLKDYNLTGGLSPIATKLIVSQLTPEDLNDKNIRLIVGIHFLIINANMRN